MRWLARIATFCVVCFQTPGAQATELPKGGYVYPVVNARTTSGYGVRLHPILKRRRVHSGVDLAAPVGSQIRAIASGVVAYTGWYSGYGNVVVLRHKGEIKSLYAHCASVVVKTGESIAAGQVVARVGSSGRATGPHLHLEVRVNDKRIDPSQLF